MSVVKLVISPRRTLVISVYTRWTKEMERRRKKILTLKDKYVSGEVSDFCVYALNQSEALLRTENAKKICKLLH